MKINVIDDNISWWYKLCKRKLNNDDGAFNF